MAFAHSVAFSEDSDMYEDVNIDLPDLEETQLFQAEDEIRDVALYLKTKNGKVEGPQLPPFQLPNRWTFDTLKRCIVDYIERSQQRKSVVIDNLYYKKARGKAVVIIKSDGDLPAVLNEYPLVLSNGKKKKSAVLYLAVDYHEARETTPRRSPRIANKHEKTFDIYLHEISAEMKLSQTADVIHSVPDNASLQDIISLVQTHESTRLIYTPVKGLFWLLKKQPVTLRCEEDLKTCKNAFKGGNIKLACRAINIDKASDTERTGTTTNTRKRRLDMGNKSAMTENDVWNSTPVQLVKDLERKGLLWRYSVKHLTVWTDEIINGNSGGVDEEPDWEVHIEAVAAPPKSRRASTASKEEKPSVQSSQPSPFEMMMALEAKRSETLQSAIMMMLAQSTSQMRQQNYQEPQVALTSTGKALNQMTQADCLTLINGIGLSKYTRIFTDNNVDGPMLDAFMHPSVGKPLMASIGISDEDCLTLVPEIYRLKARGFNTCNSTTV